MHQTSTQSSQKARVYNNYDGQRLMLFRGITGVQYSIHTGLMHIIADTVLLLNTRVGDAHVHR